VQNPTQPTAFRARRRQQRIGRHAGRCRGSQHIICTTLRPISFVRLRCKFVVRVLTNCFQAIMYAMSAAVSTYFFAMWKRADSDLKSRVWRRYGWFCALAFFGSVGGLVAAAADIQSRYNFQRFAFILEQDPCRALKSDLVAYRDCYAKSAYTTAQMLFWLPVSYVPSAIEFFCICCVNLLVRFHVSVCSSLPAYFARCRVILFRLLREWWISSQRGSLSGVGSLCQLALPLFPLQS
jgi:hypothetical protein